MFAAPSNMQIILLGFFGVFLYIIAMTCIMCWFWRRRAKRKRMRAEAKEKRKQIRAEAQAEMISRAAAKQASIPKLDDEEEET